MSWSLRIHHRGILPHLLHRQLQKTPLLVEISSCLSVPPPKQLRPVTLLHTIHPILIVEENAIRPYTRTFTLRARSRIEHDLPIGVHGHFCTQTHTSKPPQQTTNKHTNTHTNTKFVPTTPCESCTTPNTSTIHRQVRSTAYRLPPFT